MNAQEWHETIRPWLRDTHAPAFEAALEWLLPRCRTPEERILAPALLLLLSPFNALVAPCRPAAGSCVNFQITLSRFGAAGPERVRLTVRSGSGASESETASQQPAASDHPELCLNASSVIADPLGSAARVLGALLDS